MNISHLRAFREIMETGSISQAARNLNRTQPAISLALKSLEETLGFALFDRDGRALRPVPEAQYLFAEACSILDQLSTVRRTMQRFQEAETGTLNVAAMPGVSTVLFPRFLSRMMSLSDDITLSTLSRSSPQIRELVSSQSLDFGFGDHEPEAKQAHQATETVISGRCFVAIHVDNPLAQKPTLTISDLGKTSLGGMQRAHAFQQRVDQAFVQAGARQDMRIQTQIPLNLFQFVATGHCAAILDPLSVASGQSLSGVTDHVRIRPLDHPLRYDYAILRPRFRPLSHLARDVLSAWQDEVIGLLADLGADPVIRAPDDTSGVAPV